MRILSLLIALATLAVLAMGVFVSQNNAAPSVVIIPAPTINITATYQPLREERVFGPTLDSIVEDAIRKAKPSKIKKARNAAEREVDGYLQDLDREVEQVGALFDEDDR